MRLAVTVFTVAAMIHGVYGQEERAQVSDVLARYGETLEKKSPWLYVKSRIIEEWDDPALKHVVVRFARDEFSRSRSRLNLYREGSLSVPAVDDVNLPPFQPAFQELWDGTTYYYVVNRPSLEKSWASVRKSTDQQALSTISRSYSGAPLEGYFPGDEEHILTILREEALSTARVHDAVLDGVLCRVVEADTNASGRGRYRIWFDPQHGHNICRAEVTREANDLGSGASAHRAQPRARRPRTIRFVLDKVHFEQFGGVWLPTSGQWETIYVYDDGTIKTMTRYYKCLKAECRPDDVMTDHVFVPNIRDGTVIRTMGKSGVLRDVWRDGKPEPEVDWQLIKATDDAVGAHAAERKNVNEDGLIGALARGGCPNDVETGRRSAAHPTMRARVAPQGYCGLYCIYAALRLSGVDVVFTELLKSEYLGSPRGSSLSELKLAAEDHRLHAVPVGRLTIGDLKASACPLILHVKHSYQSANYDHYVVFLGIESGQAVVFDPPDLKRVGLSGLTSRWDGTALAISSQPINVGHLTRRGRVLFLTWCVIALGLVGLLRVGGRLFPPRELGCLHRLIGLSFGQAVALGFTVALVALTYHAARDTGLLGKATASQLVREAHVADFLLRREPVDVEALLADGATFVDARRPSDYEAGHVPGAISLPVDANDSVFLRIVGTIPPESKIVVYCQSQGCPYADIMARRLVHANMQDVSILRGGWYEWSRWSTRKEKHAAVRNDT